MSNDIRVFKRTLLRNFDQIYMELFRCGVKRLTIDVVRNNIIIIGEHARLPGLAALDRTNRFITRMTDVALLDESKLHLRRMMEEQFPEITVTAILNDYDPNSQVASTVIVTEGIPYQ